MPSVRMLLHLALENSLQSFKRCCSARRIKEFSLCLFVPVLFIVIVLSHQIQSFLDNHLFESMVIILRKLLLQLAVIVLFLYMPTEPVTEGGVIGHV